MIIIFICNRYIDLVYLEDLEVLEKPRIGRLRIGWYQLQPYKYGGTVHKLRFFDVIICVG